MILLDPRNGPDYAWVMNLLPIGDGSTYIDLSRAKEFDLQGVKYYKSERGVWARKEADILRGQAVPEREAFKAFMSAGRFAEAKEHFQKLFKNGSKVTAVIEKDKRSDAKMRALWRFAFGALAGLSLIAYIAAIIAGKIPLSHQISIADLIAIAIVVIAIGILIQPEALSNIQEFGIGGVSVKMKTQLQNLKNTQENQKKELEDLRFTLDMLVTNSERKHLENLLAGSTSNYNRNEWLQAELRRLRTIGLIKSKRFIFEMPDEFDLSEWVELTDRGYDYLRRWNESNR